MIYQYTPAGICARSITINVENGMVTDVQFVGGCNGNLKGIGSLVRGMRVEDVIERLEGITCGPKSTSCPDQLANALQAMQNQ